MACGNNGCNGNIVTNKLLDGNGLTYLKNLFNGKLFSIWGSLTAKGEKPINVEQSIGTAGETIVVVSVDEAGKDDEGNYTSGVMSAEDKAKLDGISVSGVTEGNGLTVDSNGNISMSEASETEAGAMSSEDKVKLDGISVSGVTEGNGLTVDSNGNISMSEASETEAGAMSSEDKVKLDSLKKIGVTEGNGLSVDADGNISMSLATEGSAGAMSPKDKEALDNLSSALTIHFLESPALVFSANSNSAETIFEVIRCGEQVRVDSVAVTGDANYEITTTGNYNINVEAKRTSATETTTSAVQVQCRVGDESIVAYIPIYALSPCMDVLKGQVEPNYPEENKLEATLWTFNDATPTVRYVRTGAYWVNLPSSWAKILGEFDITRLFVQVTMGGNAKGSHVYCGRFDPGDTWNGDTASTDCWGAILVLVEAKDGVAVDNGFYINVAYMPSVDEYICTKEEEQADEGEHTFDYDAPVVELSYLNVPNDGGTSEPTLSYSQKWRIDGVEQTPITGGGEVKYELVENLNSKLFSVSVDETTGVVTVTPTSYTHEGAVDVCSVKATVWLNGVSGEGTAIVSSDGRETSVVTVYMKPVIDSLEYPDIPANGGTVSPSKLTYHQDWSDNMGNSGTITNEGGTFTFSYTEDQASGTIDSNTGALTVSAVNSSTSRITAGSVVCDVTMNNTTSEKKDVDVYQEAGEDSEPEPDNDDPEKYHLATGTLVINSEATGLEASDIELRNVGVSVRSSNHNGVELNNYIHYHSMDDPQNITQFGQVLSLLPNSDDIELTHVAKLSMVGITFEDTTLALNDKQVKYNLKWHYGEGKVFERSGNLYLPNKDMGDAGEWTTDEYDQTDANLYYGSSYEMYPEVVLTITD